MKESDGEGAYIIIILCWGEMHNVSTRPDVEKRARLIVVALNAIRFSRFNSFIAFLHDLNLYDNQAVLQSAGRITTQIWPGFMKSNFQ
jgi:hypothetical protein